MPLLADLISKEKNRRVVNDLFRSSSPAPLLNVVPPAAGTLDEQLLILESILFEGQGVDKANAEAIISELEAIACNI